jgi:single-stranded-DNA-specific exonuclease
MIQTIAKEKFGLIITIDYGTTNIKELNLARKLGLQTIVVDHHHVGDLKTPADVFINPNQKGCGFAKKILSASGLAWYLITGLKKCLPQAKDVDAKTYLDLACLGTICDMVPLIGANRVIAKRGLELLALTQRPGLISLKNVSGVRDRVTCSDVGFGMGPRLNAAGRMVHGDVVIELLTTSDSNVSSKLAQRLNKLNTERQDTEARVKECALEQIRERGHLPAGLVVWDPEFHTGVVGIVAQRVVEQFYRPTVVLGVDTDGIYKGSVRGIKGFNVVEALTAVSEHLIKYGGHEGAGGLSVEEARLEEFAEAFIRVCEERLQNLGNSPIAEADTEVTLPELDLKLVEEFQKFAPFGVGNPNPQLLVKGLKVLDVRVLKDTHLKTTLTDGKRFVSGLMWRQKSHPALQPGAIVNIVCRPDSSSFNGRIELQANLQAIEKA